jgi:phosphoribosylaminoimidazolecarboxamide formyltransferase/IMP cyclohydrolase
MTTPPAAPVAPAAEDRRPIRRALVSVYDKSGLEELVRGLADAGVELVSTGGSAALIAGLGLPVTKVEDLTGFPECLEGRVKTLHPRVHAGILADTRKPDHLAQLADLGVAALRARRRQPLPVRRDRRLGRRSRRVRRADRHRRPVDGARRRQEPPERRVLTDPGQYADALAAVREGGFTFAATPAPGGRGVRPHRGIRRRGRRPGWAACTYATPPTGRLPRLAGATYTRQLRRGCATARTRTSRPPSTRPTAQPGSPRPSSCTARRCPTTTTSTPTPRCGRLRPRRPADRARSSSTPTRAASPSGREDIADAHRKAHECDPVSAFGGVIATNRTVTLEMAETVKDIFTEVVVAPVVRRRRACGPDRQEEHPPAHLTRRRPAAGSRPAGRSPAVCSSQQSGLPSTRRRRPDVRTTSRPRGRRRPGPLDARRRRASRRGHLGRPRSSPGARCAR